MSCNQGIVGNSSLQLSKYVLQKHWNQTPSCVLTWLIVVSMMTSWKDKQRVFILWHQEYFTSEVTERVTCKFWLCEGRGSTIMFMASAMTPSTNLKLQMSYRCRYLKCNWSVVNWLPFPWPLLVQQFYCVRLLCHFFSCSASINRALMTVFTEKFASSPYQTFFDQIS